MINWNNMDTLASYQALQETKKVNLAQEMRGENGAKRVKSYTVPMGAGMDFNYGARPVDDAILEKLSAFAAEAQLAEKFEALYNGAVINTGENRLVLHHLCRGQLGNPVIADGVNIFKRCQTDKSHGVHEIYFGIVILNDVHVYLIRILACGSKLIHIRGRNNKNFGFNSIVEFYCCISSAIAVTVVRVVGSGYNIRIEIFSAISVDHIVENDIGGITREHTSIALGSSESYDCAHRVAVARILFCIGAFKANNEGNEIRH